MLDVKFITEATCCMLSQNLLLYLQLVAFEFSIISGVAYLPSCLSQAQSGIDPSKRLSLLASRLPSKCLPETSLSACCHVLTWGCNVETSVGSVDAS